MIPTAHSGPQISPLKKKTNMKDTQHTPGPWRVKQTGFTYFRDLTILGEDWHGEETPIAAALVRNALHPYGRADKARAEIEANARLIAAAPELLSALAGCADALREAGKDFARANPRAARPNLYELHEKAARAAIAKATGGAE